jgi:UrcA family protein
MEYEMLDLLAFAAFAAATRATLDVDVRQQSRIVHYGDLDLTTAIGRQRLDRRVHDAARRVCWDQATRKALPTHDELRCRKEALASASIKVAEVVARYNPPAPVLLAEK